jgi:hypothetical protein
MYSVLGGRDARRSLLPFLACSGTPYPRMAVPLASHIYFARGDDCACSDIEAKTPDSRRDGSHAGGRYAYPFLFVERDRPATTAAPEPGTVDDGAGSLYLEAATVLGSKPGRHQLRDIQRPLGARSRPCGRSLEDDCVLQRDGIRGTSLRAGGRVSSQEEGTEEYIPTSDREGRTPCHGRLRRTRGRMRSSPIGWRIEYSRSMGCPRVRFYGGAIVEKCRGLAPVREKAPGLTPFRATRQRVPGGNNGMKSMCGPQVQAPVAPDLARQTRAWVVRLAAGLVERAEGSGVTSPMSRLLQMTAFTRSSRS